LSACPAVNIDKYYQPNQLLQQQQLAAMLLAFITSCVSQGSLASPGQ